MEDTGSHSGALRGIRHSTLPSLVLNGMNRSVSSDRTDTAALSKRTVLSNSVSSNMNSVSSNFNFVSSNTNSASTASVSARTALVDVTNGVTSPSPILCQLKDLVPVLQLRSWVSSTDAENKNTHSYVFLLHLKRKETRGWLRSALPENFRTKKEATRFEGSCNHVQHIFYTYRNIHGLEYRLSPRLGHFNTKHSEPV